MQFPFSAIAIGFITPESSEVSKLSYFFAGANLLSVYHRNHPKFPCHLHFHVAIAVSILREVVWQERKLPNILPDPD